MNRFVFIFFTVLLAASCVPKVPGNAEQGDIVTIFPDYADVTVPRTIAPLNFRIMSDSDESVAVLESGGLRSVIKGPDIEMSISGWRRLLSDSDSIDVTIYTKKNNKWFRHVPFRFYISDDPIDGYLCYRRIFPGYGAYRAMGIYQRDLATFKETLIFGHEDAGGAEA
ncbi:MAG: hypothetical protein Q4G10_00720, partial [Bacteroidia bacterium]|nr:hypothetical protein [Bacteroidia bacterium]